MKKGIELIIRNLNDYFEVYSNTVNENLGLLMKLWRHSSQHSTFLEIVYYVVYLNSLKVYKTAILWKHNITPKNRLNLIYYVIE